MKNILVIGTTGSGKNCYVNLYLMERLSAYKHYFYNIINDESLNFIAGSNVNHSNPAFAFWLHFREKDFSFVNLYTFTDNDVDLTIEQNIDLVRKKDASKMFIYYKQNQLSGYSLQNYFIGIDQMIKKISNESLIIMDEIFDIKFLQTVPCDKIVITQSEKLLGLNNKEILSTFNEIWLGSNIRLDSELYKNMKELFTYQEGLKFINFETKEKFFINPSDKVRSLSKKPKLF